MRRHLREMRIALEIFAGSSSISTTSAASIAASEPIAPMAMPISARPNTGASFMPSPTKANLYFSGLRPITSSTFSTFPAGSNSLYTSSIPNSEATCSATAPASPVSIIVFSIPAALSEAIASLAPGFITSEITICPAYSPSTAI